MTLCYTLNNHALINSNLLLSSRVLLYGRLSPKCLSTYFKYGCALLYAQPLSAPKQDVLKDITNKHDTKKGMVLPCALLSYINYMIIIIFIL
jgi:hypothetical protein